MRRPGCWELLARSDGCEPMRSAREYLFNALQPPVVAGEHAILLRVRGGCRALHLRQRWAKRNQIATRIDVRKSPGARIGAQESCSSVLCTACWMRGVAPSAPASRQGSNSPLLASRRWPLQWGVQAHGALPPDQLQQRLQTRRAACQQRGRVLRGEKRVVPTLSPPEGLVHPPPPPPSPALPPSQPRHMPCMKQQPAT